MRPTAGRGRLSNHLNVAPIQELAFHVSGGMCCSPPRSADGALRGHDSKPEPLHDGRAGVRLCCSGAASERGCRDGGPYRLVSGLPTGVGEPLPGGRSVPLVANRCLASDDIPADAPCASHRRGDRDSPGGAAVVRAGLGAGGIRDRVQAARHRHETGPGQRRSEVRGLKSAPRILLPLAP
jgi:hypothetical protein